MREMHVSIDKRVQKVDTNPLVTNLLSSSRIIDVGEIRIARATQDAKRGGRYLIYLPTTRSYLWRVLHELGVKVRVYIEVPEDALKKLSQEGVQMK
jgi:hypothetical protein